MTKVLVLLSGGLDSATCLAKAVDCYKIENVIALSFYYGQKHSRELDAVDSLVKYYGVEHLTLNLSAVFASSDSTLLAGRNEIAQGTYEHQLKSSPVIATYVPFRNGLFISAAASIALSKNCGEIWYGAHSNDAAFNAYPDCSVDFLNSMKSALYIGSGNKLTLHAPFISLTKKDIVEIGKKLNVPYELTWSCYEGKEQPCGKCATCIDRENAFKLNGLTDPLLQR